MRNRPQPTTRTVALTLALLAIVCGLVWLAWPSKQAAWTLTLRADADDRLSITVGDCSTNSARFIAIDPKRPLALFDRTVGTDRAVVLKRVTSKTVITLQLYNDVGFGGVSGTAEADGHRVFAFQSPVIADGETQRVWAASYHGDGRRAPVPKSCRTGLPASAIAPARPAGDPNAPQGERGPAPAMVGGILLALAVGLYAAHYRRARARMAHAVPKERVAIWTLAASLATTAAVTQGSHTVRYTLCLIAAVLIGFAMQHHLADKHTPEVPPVDPYF